MNAKVWMHNDDNKKYFSTVTYNDAMNTTRSLVFEGNMAVTLHCFRAERQCDVLIG